jgi:hypothetical protein
MSTRPNMTRSCQMERSRMQQATITPLSALRTIGSNTSFHTRVQSGVQVLTIWCVRITSAIKIHVGTAALISFARFTALLLCYHPRKDTPLSFCFMQRRMRLPTSTTLTVSKSWSAKSFSASVLCIETMGTSHRLPIMLSPLRWTMTTA